MIYLTFITYIFIVSFPGAGPYAGTEVRPHLNSPVNVKWLSYKSGACVQYTGSVKPKFYLSLLSAAYLVLLSLGIITFPVIVRKT